MSQKQRVGHLAYSNGPAISKPLFKENEKVLCYEPDEKKAQVLYNSKVLEVVRQETHGKLYYEYKIHFQGWNSSWDRYVREDNVLKDTEDNRNLQQKLQEQAQLLNKNSMKKKNKKKTISEKLKAATQAKDSAGHPINPTKGESNNHQSSDQDTTDPESSEDEGKPKESQQLVVPEDLKKILEDDFFSVKEKKFLVKLPARYTVVDLLEDYIFHVGRQELSTYIDKMNKLPSIVPSNVATGTTSVSGTLLGGKSNVLPSTKTPTVRVGSDTANEELIKTFQRINFTKKIVEDVRIMFDFLLYQILLYQHENDQYNEFLKGDYYQRNRKIPEPRMEQEKKIPGLKLQPEKIVRPPPLVRAEGSEPLFKRRKTMLYETMICKDSQLPSTGNGNSSFSGTPPASGSNNPPNKCDLENKCEFPWACEQLNRFMDELCSYQMLPPGEIEGNDVHPSLCYGMYHLLRLFVKMPELLSKTSIPRKKMRSIVAEINNLLVYLSELKNIVTDKDWYNPDAMYEEDFIDETNCHLFPRGQVANANNHVQEIPSSSETNLRKDSPFAGPSTTPPVLRSIKSENPTTKCKQAVLTDQQELSTTIQSNIKAEGVRMLERLIKRNPRRIAGTKTLDSKIMDGSALGVRKSLSVEELSRETLVAANNPDTKTYSLRMNCRVPYK